MTPSTDTGERIFVAGHRGMVGSALVRRLERAGCRNLVLRSREQLDLLDQRSVSEFFRSERIDAVYLAAARVGGILANASRPADFLLENLLIECNVIHAAWRAGVRRLMFLGSSCIYPRDCPQPIREEYLLAGPLEPTNEAYAIAKIAGLKLCESYNRQHGTNYLAVMPTNLYGPNDNYDPETSHVLPAMIRKVAEARDAGKGEIVLWGTGTPLREFLHVDDLADACVFLMQRPDASGVYNVGSGEECSIAELARLVMRVMGFDGTLGFDPSRPDGTPRKRLDTARLDALGWKASISLEQGVAETCRDFAARGAGCRGAESAGGLAPGARDA